MNTAMEVQTDSSGFVEGTPVWTEHGLKPIEHLRSGDMVLSHPAATGTQKYKRVLNAFVGEGRVIWHLSYYDPRSEDMGYIYATGNHPFWTGDAGWVTLELLKSGQNLELSDGTIAVVYKCEVLYRTAEPNIGFVTTDHGDKYFGFRVDLAHAFDNVSRDGEDLLHHLRHDDPPMRRRIIDIEVEGLHAYYVGEGGLRTRDVR